MTALDELTIALEARIPVLLVGSSGRGKSYIAERHLLTDDQSVIKVQMTPQTEELPLYGTINYDANTQAFTHHDGPLTKAYLTGARLIVEEITTSPADVAHLWHPVGNGEAISVKTDGFRTIDPAPGFQMIGTSNLETYAGNYRLSPAFYSRFHLIEWNGMSLDEEAEFFCSKYPALPAETVIGYVTIAHQLQSKAGAQRVEFALGMREVERACLFASRIADTDATPWATAFAITMRRACALLAPELLAALDPIAEQHFPDQYDRTRYAA